MQLCHAATQPQTKALTLNVIQQTALSVSHMRFILRTRKSVSIRGLGWTNFLHFKVGGLGIGLGLGLYERVACWMDMDDIKCQPTKKSNGYVLWFCGMSFRTALRTVKILFVLNQSINVFN